MSELTGPTGYRYSRHYVTRALAELQAEDIVRLDGHGTGHRGHRYAAVTEDYRQAREERKTMGDRQEAALQALKALGFDVEDSYGFSIEFPLDAAERVVALAKKQP